MRSRVSKRNVENLRDEKIIIMLTLVPSVIGLKQNLQKVTAKVLLLPSRSYSRLSWRPPRGGTRGKTCGVQKHLGEQTTGVSLRERERLAIWAGPRYGANTVG